MRSRSGPSNRTIPASTARPAIVPSAAERQPRNVATASTIVKASTTSTSEARNAAITAGVAMDQVMIFLCSAILVMRVEDPSRIIVKQPCADLEPCRGVRDKPATIKIQLFYFLEPAL